MAKRRGHIPGGTRLATALIAALVAGSCARDGEAALRAHLEQWFFLGKTYYFESHMRCTAALIHVRIDRPRPGLAVQDHPEKAKAALRAEGVAAIRIPGLSPTDLTDAMLLSGTGTFGKEALAAGSLSGPCLGNKRVQGFLHEALTRPGATMVYDGATEGLMILDPARNRLFYIAGDVW